MQISQTGLEGLIEIFPRIFEDERGFFFESFNEKSFNSHCPGVRFVQDNQSFSKKGVIRGIHFQLPPFAQGKLVRVISGKVLDVAVDLRKSSKTFGKYFSCILDGSKNNMLYIPEGFGHGFAALEESVFFYKCTNFYDKNSETGLLWNDPVINIEWGIKDPIVSSKDKDLGTFDPKNVLFD